MLLRVFAVCMMMFCFAASTVSTVVPAYADEQQSTGEFTVGDLASKATGGLDSAKGYLVKICAALCPVSLIVIILSLLLTKDPRKVQEVVKAAAIVCVATGLILLINKGMAIDLIESLTGQKFD